ncbi:abortive infection family protein [Microbispora rosea]|uniref:abortive infection family protein n=1 Tax=Microbispora rosea TaxID=58117 RepID=UPI0004C324B8|nr:abortive infection family protein [Microbispora rosea]
MMTHVLNAELKKPEALDLASWAAIQDPLSRLKKAVDDDDRPLIVGSAKEVVEATARVILQVRGNPAGSGEEYDKVLASAHRVIEYQPGPGITLDAAVRQAASAAKKLAGALRELRNAYGTGHGRSTLQPVEDEVLETCVDGALLWTRWALRRLQFLLVGALQPLINDLRAGTFTMGSLATRLQAANLPAMEQDDLRALGVAVGQRAASNTFTVRIDGVEACAASQDDSVWPPAYREGLVEGLFIDQFGQVQVDEGVLGVRLAAEVLLPHAGQEQILHDLKKKLVTAAWSPAFMRTWPKVVAEMRLHSVILRTEEARQVWSDIAYYFQSTGLAYASSSEESNN